MSVRSSYFLLILSVFMFGCNSSGGGDGDGGDDGKSIPHYSAKVIDVNTNLVKSSIYQSNQEFKEFNGWVYFRHNDLVYGTELWRTNNSVTQRVTDINPRGNSNPARLTIFNNWLYFVATGDTSGTELWRTDGTQTQLVRDIRPQTASSRPENLVVYGNWLYFKIDNDTNSADIWRTNGTITEPANIFTPGSRTYFSDFYVFNGWLYFNQEAQLKRTNLVTTENVVESSTQNPIGQVFQYTTIGDELFFLAYGPNSQRTLWLTDNSTTVKIRDFNPTYSQAYMFIYNKLIHYQDEDIDGNSELWSANGATENLVLSAAGTSLSGFSNFTEYNGELYFTAADTAVGVELFRFDDMDTILVADINPTGSSDPHYLTTKDNYLYFVAASDGSINQVWYTDGTKTPEPSSSNPSDMSNPYAARFYKAGSNLYLLYNTASTKQLWVHDTSLRLVEDLTTYGTAGSNPYNLVTVDNDLYFLADDGVDGIEIWKASETTKSRITDINTLSNENDISLMFGYDGYAYFSMFSDILGDNELWRTNGIVTETVLETATDNPIGTDLYSEGDTVQHVLFNNTMHFVAWSITDSAYVMYRTNGNTTETVTPLDANSSYVDTIEFVIHNGWLYFAKDDAQTNIELWRTDGTSVSLVEDINTMGSSNPLSLTVAGSWLYFTADDGVNGRALWRTDGTTTTLIKDGSDMPFTNTSRILGAENSLYFLTSVSSSNFTLWHLNGSVPQPIDLTATNINYTSNINNLYAVGDYMIISSISYGAWITNGEPPIGMGDGTLYSAPGIFNGWAYYSSSGSFSRTNGAVVEKLFDEDDEFYARDTTPVVYNNYLFFAAGSDIDGSGLWYTDGTNYHRVAVPNPTGRGTFFDNITKAGDQLYFLGSDALYGDEVWSLQLQ